MIFLELEQDSPRPSPARRAPPCRR